MAVVPFQLLTKQEVAKLLQSSVRTVENLVTKGQIPAPAHVGRRVFWHSDQIYEWLNGKFGIRNALPLSIPEPVMQTAGPGAPSPVESARSVVVTMKTTLSSAASRARARQARNLSNLANEGAADTKHA